MKSDVRYSDIRGWQSMATNPFKQSPPIPPPSSNQISSNGQQQNYDDRVPPLPCATTTTTTTTIAIGAASAALSNITTTPATDNSILKQRAPCACSNISIMQLFHEMKQKYPTVPDTVVSELVTQHCHDRPTCIGRLEEAVLGTPAQTTYPAQSIHSGSLKRRSAGPSSRGGTGRLPHDGCSGSGSSSNSSVSSAGSSSSNSSSRESSVDSRTGALAPKAGAGTHPSTAAAAAAATRPTTLAVGQRPAPAAPPVPPMRPNRTAPLCPPPPPPLASSSITTTSSTSSSSADRVGETVNVRLNVTVSPVSGGGQRHKSMISLQPEPPYSCELANVTSTFNSGLTPAGIVTATAITPNARGPPLSGGVHAAAAATGGGTPSGRSSTSVNLTLRQPTDGRPHSPILVHASPLKYTSKNFNAQSGIQSKLEVTFGDGFGSFRAVRAHVPGYDQHCAPQHQQPQQQQQAAARSPFLPATTQEELQQEMLGFGDDREPFWQMPLTTSSPLPHVSIAATGYRMQPSRGTLGGGGALRGGSTYAATGSGNLESDGLTKELRYQNFVVAEMAVSQQLEQKQRLSKEVERKRMQFELICREIYVLQKPLRSIDAELLNREVLLLAAEVEQLQKEVDSCDDEEALAAVAAAGAGVSITDGLSALSVEGGSPMLPPGNGSAVVNRPPRPPRPPPPRVPGQSPCPSSAGSITPGTPLFPSGNSGHPFGIGYPPASGSSSSSSSSSAPSPFTPSSIGGGDPLLAGQRPEGESGGSGSSSSNSSSQQQPGGLPNQPWTCSLCTFQNHELMTSCEVCSLPKASVVTSGQDIHIYLSPGQNKIIHSWIVS
ncbi:uncharacterized protein PB18E9.04c-like isoform X4 [Anopheles albimanus]|uniref:uncharacterized protein PB18E9.04c-like isoform X4 n=1 Tax=Anopheles albimanus TaxID=7167 RepID=UPI00163DEA9C|nr:uncharacterized protein PB18E9.04c-like isoform X4 [Anopheles albimanus]